MLNALPVHKSEVIVEKETLGALIEGALSFLLLCNFINAAIMQLKQPVGILQNKAFDIDNKCVYVKYSCLRSILPFIEE